jgi:IMP dehydrogenase
MSKNFYKALGTSEVWPKLSSVHPSSITYADVTLLQQISKVKSRSELDISVKFGPYTLQVPVITAPMDTISGEAMIREMHKLGGLGTLPRGEMKESLAICKKLVRDKVPCIYAVGLNTALEDAEKFKEYGAEVVLLDVANGAMERVIKTAVQIKKLGLTIVAGNISNYELAVRYKEAGIDIARVGVGPGGGCDTRQVAGTGFPQLSAVLETSTVKIPVIADGGIREPGDVDKAIAAGAQTVMIGSLFAGCDETPGKVVKGKKYFRGQASEEYMRDHGLETDSNRAAEGVSTYVSVQGPVKKVVDKIKAGLKSAMSYSGATNIKDFQKKAQFVLVSEAAVREGKPWILNGR